VPVFQNLVATIENADALDGPADRLANGVDSVLKPSVRSVLSGVWLGHPVHPLLVTAPIGAWVSASALDATKGNEVAARRLVGLGIAAAAGAVVTGLSDWRGTTGRARRVGVVHMTANTAALAVYTASWRARVAGRQRRGAVLALVGATLLSAGGYLGGHLTYALGANVDPDERAGSAPSEALTGG
jgi:uncharacterized membrane protein